MKKKLNKETILEMARGFQPSCVIIAAAELDVFTILHARPMNAVQLAARIKGDLRAVIILLDALVALGFLTKSTDTEPVYRVPKAVAEVLTADGAQSMLGMVRHLGNCQRAWGQLASVVLRGKPAVRRPSVLGADGDLASFIQAMHEVRSCGDTAVPAGKLTFTHLLILAAPADHSPPTQSRRLCNYHGSARRDSYGQAADAQPGLRAGCTAPVIKKTHCRGPSGG